MSAKAKPKTPNGRILMIAMLVFIVVFTGGLWYTQFYAFYEETEAERVEIAGRAYAVSEWQGIDAPTSPLKLRACFRLTETPEAPAAPEPTPLVPPPWFDCFDAEALSRDLAAGRALAYLAEAEEFDGADRVIARYPDGRAYMWRQLTEEFARQ
ncbi:MAG: DUF6446 family protein [Pseudomonadota bacterium]